MKTGILDKRTNELQRAEFDVVQRRGRPLGRRLVVAVLCVLTAFAIRCWLTSVLGEELPFLFFVAAALVAAWYGGAVMGLAALALGLFLGEDFFVAPRGIPYPVELFDFIRYVFTASLGVGLIEVLRRGKRRTEAALDELRSEIARRERSELALREAQQQLGRHAEQLKTRVAERTAELSATVDSLRDLLYHIAHNLRAPLRAMEGYATLLQRNCSNLDATACDYSRRIARSAQYMDELIQDLLDYGSLGHADITLMDVNLAEAVHEATAQLAPRIASTHAEVNTLEPLPVIRANPLLLRRILLALLDNALKFVPAAVAPRIQIRWERRNSKVRLWIEDNGIGVDPRFRDRIFGAFERLHTSDAYEGTGIGLAIVKQGMLRMGGDAGVESQLGTGSRFWLEFEAGREVPKVKGIPTHNLQTAAM